MRKSKGEHKYPYNLAVMWSLQVRDSIAFNNEHQALLFEL